MEEILIYLRVLKKRLWLIALLTLSTVGTIFLQQSRAEPVYSASLQFQITAPPQGEVVLYESFRTTGLRDEISLIRESFLNVLTSSSVARQVIENLSLSNLGSRDISTNIKTQEITGSDFTRVQVHARSPQLAVDLTNAVVDEALRQYGQLRARSVTMSRQFIEAELNVVRQELQQAEEELIAVQIENHVGSLNEMITEQQSLLGSLQLDRDRAFAKGLVDEVEKYDQLIAQREGELQGLVRQSARYSALEAEVQQLRKTHNFLLEKEAEAKLTENETLNVGFIQVLSSAHPASRPVTAINFKVLALGGLVSLVLGALIAYVWEYVASEDRALQAVQVNIIDGETGVYNKGYFMQRLGEEMARAKRQGYPLSVALLNIDNLGALQVIRSPQARNELFGKTAALIKQFLREEHVLAHFEGGTFAFLLPDMSEEEAKAMTNRLQMGLAWTPFEIGRSSAKIFVSSAVGVAVFNNGVARDQLIALADEALQRAVANGQFRETLLAEDAPRIGQEELSTNK